MDPGHIIEARTMFDAWKAINDYFIFGGDDDSFMLAGRELPRGREFSCMTDTMHLEATNGFGMPEEPTILMQHPERRIKLLRSRYIDEPLWEEGLSRLRDKARSPGGPMSYVFAFHRPADAAPTGGGCLISLVFTWKGKLGWKLHINSRASEITVRLLGDIYFLQHMVEEVLDALPAKRDGSKLKWWDWDNLPITWDIILCSQMRHVVPAYLRMTHGNKASKAFLMSDPADLPNERARLIQDYHWQLGVHPELISWAQRRKWSEVFLANSKYDWAKLERKFMPIYEASGRKVVRG